MRARSARTALALAAGLLVALAAGPARADVIDGNWCFTDGRYFTIEGPEIVTPGGAHLRGNYSRHFFGYSEGGATIYMTLVNEMTVHLRRQAEQGPYEVWRRCQPRVSAAGGATPGRS